MNNKFIGKPDSYLKRKQRQCNLIMRSAHRMPINYLMIIDYRKQISDALHENSFNRATGRKLNNVGGRETLRK